MTLASGAVKHPIAVLFFTLAVLLAGLFSYSTIEVESFPEMKFPQVSIVTTYPGAAPSELDALVTVPIEMRIKLVKNVKEISSTTREGSSEVTVTFLDNVDLKQATADIKTVIQEVTNRLPDEVRDPVVVPVDMTDLPVIILSITGERSPNALKQIAESCLQDPLSKVPGVGEVEVLGGTRPCIRVEVDQLKLRKYGLSLTDVGTAINSANRNLPGGNVKIEGGNFLVRTICAFKNDSDIASVPVDIRRQPPVLVRDVAKVSSTYYPFEGISRVNGRANVMVQVKKAYKANLLRVAKRCLAKLKVLEGTLPKGVKVVLRHDLSEFVEDQMSQVKSSALVGGLLAMAILYLFLRRGATTAIIALSIPLSVLITLSVMLAFDASLNYMSLAGIILALGMLVDDSIVVLENAVRHNELGKTREEAAADGANEIASAVLASTITTLIVFAPVFLIGNWGPGTLLKTMSFSLVVAVSASYFVAMTVVPATCALFVGQASEPSQGGRPSPTIARPYRKVLRFLLRHPILCIFFTFFLFVISFIFVFSTGFDGELSIGSKSIPIYFRFTPGTSKVRKEAAFAYFEKIVEKAPEVRATQAWTNESRGDGTLMADFGIHGKKSLVEKLKKRLRAHLNSLPGVTVSFRSLTSLAGKSPIEVKVRGKDSRLIAQATRLVTKTLRDVPGLVNVQNTLQSEKREIHVVVNRPRAAARGVAEAEIAATVRTAIFGTVATRVVRENKEVDVLIKLRDSQGLQYEALGDVLVRSTRGEFIPLREVAAIEWATAVPEICKSDHKQEVRVLADVENDGQLAQLARKTANVVRQLRLPAGVEIDYGGKAKEEAEGKTKMLMALAFAIFLVYAVMAIQFESFIQPLIIMMALPLAMIGCNFALVATGVRFGLMSAIGVILLSGVVVNDAIVLVDYVNQVRRTNNTNRLRAVLEAGSVRLRPILMTSLTTIFGVFPMALGFGHGAEVYVPLGISLVGGLTFATVLTLGIIPVVYVVTEDVIEWLLNLWHRLKGYERTE